MQKGVVFSILAIFYNGKGKKHMVAQPSRSKMSVEEYLAFDRDSRENRYEFIDGSVYMLAGGTLTHARIIANSIRELGNALRNGSCSVYTSDARVRLSEKRYVYPDITVTCDARDEDGNDILLYPRLVIEVLSKSTEAYDRGDKFDFYRSCPTIEEYVLVNTQRMAIEVYRREQHPFWRLSPFKVDDIVELVSIGVSLPIAAIYENVKLSEE